MGVLLKNYNKIIDYNNYVPAMNGSMVTVTPETLFEFYHAKPIIWDTSPYYNIITIDNNSKAIQEMIQWQTT